jgi:hypothetical protein
MHADFGRAFKYPCLAGELELASIALAKCCHPGPVTRDTIMAEILSNLRPGELIGLVAVGGGMLCGIISILMGGMYKMRQLALKEEMVQRGLSADDICAILGSRSCKDDKKVSQS